jgi:REP element-mobilizing transposase RayT
MGMLFKNRFRVESTRLQSWNYSTPGYYFVTLCAKRRRCFFGDEADGEMRLSGIGRVVEHEWRRIPEVWTGVGIDAFVVMPNHLHGIVVLTGGMGLNEALEETHLRGVSTRQWVRIRSCWIQSGRGRCWGM